LESVFYFPKYDLSFRRNRVGRAAMTQQTVNVTEFIDARPVSRFQFKVIALCGLTVMLDGFDTQSIGFIAPAIINQFSAQPSQFGLVISAALVGLLVGSITFGMLADKIGRKNVIIYSSFGFGFFSLLTAFAQSLDQLLILRFLTGLGLGGAMPNLIALTTEYSPKRLKAFMVVAMFSGFPLGAVVGGIVSAHLVGLYGWQSIFVLGGVAPIALAFVLIRHLPESIPFLVKKANRQIEQGAAADAAITRGLVARHMIAMGPGESFDADTVFTISEATPLKSSVAALFAQGRGIGTLMLWTIHFTNLLTYYFLVGWLPTVLTSGGLGIGQAILVTVLMGIGTVCGGVLLARLIDKFGSYQILALNYVGAATVCVLIGVLNQHLVGVSVMVFFAGFCVGGSQLIANALAATYYPTEMRSTGVGWALGAARSGAVVGPIIGGFLLSMQLNTQELFSALTVPTLIAAVAVFALGKYTAAQHRVQMN